MKKWQDEHKCAVCGKLIIATSLWAYQRNHRYYCSYKCYNVKPDKHKGCSASEEILKRDNDIYTDFKSGMSVREISDKYKLSMSYVNHIICKRRNAEI